MRLHEIIIPLENGCKMRRRSWEKQLYVYEINGDCYWSTGEFIGDVCLLPDARSFDWEEYEEDEYYEEELQDDLELIRNDEEIEKIFNDNGATNMKFLEAMMLINEGNKVRMKHWKEGEYIYLNDNNEVCWSNGDNIVNIPSVGEWEIYDDRKYAHPIWRKLYKSIIDLAPDFDSFEECDEDGCDACAFRCLCKMYDDMFMTLESFNSKYKLDKKELPEDCE